MEIKINVETAQALQAATNIVISNVAERGGNSSALQALTNELGQALAKAAADAKEHDGLVASLAGHFRRVAERVATNNFELNELLAGKMAQGLGLTDSQMTSLLKSQADVKVYGPYFGSELSDADLVASVGRTVQALRRQVQYRSNSTCPLTRAIGEFDQAAQFTFIDQWSETVIG